CVAALQRLLNADPPYAGIYHDGIFGPRTLAATWYFQSRYGLPGEGKADVATTRMLSRLAPAPRPVSVAATLLTLTLTGMVVLGLMTARRRRERQLSAQPPEIDASAMVRAAI
ncbi:MAG TPA: peptidoglycan-binding domain-containing protein, partial [Streptosporangiaceae bacterium]